MCIHVCVYICTHKYTTYRLNIHRGKILKVYAQIVSSGCTWVVGMGEIDGRGKEKALCFSFYIVLSELNNF